MQRGGVGAKTSTDRPLRGRENGANRRLTMPSDFVQNKRRSRDGTADGSVQDESAIFDANVFKAGLLFDFDIDAQDLKPKHTAFLDESISFMVDRLPERLKSIPPGQKHVFVWSIDGFASHTGSAGHNLILSDLR